MTQKCGMLVLTHSSHRAAVEKKTQSPQGECAFQIPEWEKLVRIEGNTSTSSKQSQEAEPGKGCWQQCCLDPAIFSNER